MAMAMATAMTTATATAVAAAYRGEVAATARPPTTFRIAVCRLRRSTAGSKFHLVCRFGVIFDPDRHAAGIAGRK
jgi:hypothetical protein